VPETFHRRGHHVQKAHGRRSQFAADDSHLDGAMIALMPTAADAKRLALPGGESAADLHCTLLFLGDDETVWSPEARDALEAAARLACAGMTAVPAMVFGVAHWNGGGDNPSWVWNVGNDPGAGLAESSLEEAHCAVGDIIGMAMAALDGDLPETPTQHSPWAAHVCAAYTDDLTLARALEKRLGPVTFDRLRLSFGSDDRDIPFTATAVGLTASGLRRDTHAHEADTDFAEHDRQWQTAVDSAASRMASVYAGWRDWISEQISAGADTPEEWSTISLGPDQGVDQAAEVLHEAMTSLALRAGKSLVREAEKQGVQVPEWSLPDDALTAAVGGRRLLGSVARMTADLMASSVVQAAKRTVTGLFTRQASPDQIASEVDRALAEAQDGLLRGPVGTAMSTAQTAGRQAVLEAAPPGEYYASEILDRNTCAPCKAVDGEQFGSLEIAIKAYPVMGYKDCVGPRYGNSCRGMIVARWTPEEPDSGPVAASAFHGTPGQPGYEAMHPDSKITDNDGDPSFYTNGDHLAALNHYTSNGYRDMNNELRHGTAPKKGTVDENRRQIDALEEMIEVQKPTTSEMTVFRGTNQILNLRPGEEFTDDGFVSTSGWDELSRDFAEEGSMFTIKVPPGSHILDVAHFGGTAAGEQEFILPPGTRFRVSSVSGSGPTEYELEVVHG
jgi:hypothetical protein